MKITPTRYEIELEISDDRKCRFTYEYPNRYFTDRASLTFSEDTRLNEIAKCIAECFLEKELEPATIDFEFHENKVLLYRSNFKEITEGSILESIAYQIK